MGERAERHDLVLETTYRLSFSYTAFFSDKVEAETGASIEVSVARILYVTAEKWDNGGKLHRGYHCRGKCSPQGTDSSRFICRVPAAAGE